MKIVIVLTLFLLSTVVMGAKCDFIPKQSIPEWVNGERSLEGYYVGVGVNGRTAKGSEVQIQRSHTDAVRDLAENIEVNISHQISIYQKSGNSSYSNRETESLTVSSSHASLKNVETDGIWLDDNSCLVWTRVKLKRKIVEEETYRQIQRGSLQGLEEMLNNISVDTADAEQQLDLVERINHRIKSIDFTVIKPKGIKSRLKLRLQQLTDSLLESQQESYSAEELFGRARESIAQSNSDSAQRNHHIVAALGYYRDVLNQFPYSTNPNEWSEKAAYQIAMLELQRKNPCSTKKYLDEIKANSNSRAWVLKVKKIYRKAKCGKKERRSYEFRNTFEEKRVLVQCRYIIKRERVWNNICDKVISYFNQNGAVATDEAGRSNYFDFSILIESRGQVKTRLKGDRNEYQFEGEVMTEVESDGSSFLEDSYSGIGGWNPISEKMAIDVLGVHVYKRFIDALHRQLGE